jgi:hypothetical protein
MKINRIVLAVTLALFGSLAILAPAHLLAQSTDHALNAFQVTVPVNINNFVYTPVTIPTGQRLVIQDVSLSGEAQATPYVQPLVILGASIGGGAVNYHYFAPSVSTVDPTQFYGVYSATVYADTLEVGPGFAGYTPSSLSFYVVITGYLVDLTPAQSCPPPAVGEGVVSKFPR